MTLLHLPAMFKGTAQMMVKERLRGCSSMGAPLNYPASWAVIVNLTVRFANGCAGQFGYNDNLS